MDTVYTRATETQKPFLKDPGSAITHLSALLPQLPGPLLCWFGLIGQESGLHSLHAVFITSMILLYTASTLYHSLDISARVNRVLKKMDHFMIFILIAGSYTPLCMVTLRDSVGPLMCLIVWSIAAVGILIKACWITCPKWFSSIIYIGMGWVCLMGFPEILNALSRQPLAGSLPEASSIPWAAFIYALKLPIFNSRHKNFGSHEIFHLFVIGRKPLPLYRDVFLCNRVKMSRSICLEKSAAAVFVAVIVSLQSASFSLPSSAA